MSGSIGLNILLWTDLAGLNSGVGDANSNNGVVVRGTWL